MEGEVHNGSATYKRLEKKNGVDASRGTKFHTLVTQHNHQANIDADERLQSGNQSKGGQKLAGQ